jgi:hypothetical protein
MRRRFLPLAVVALALGVAVWLHGGTGIVRGHVGDVAATMLVFAVLGLVAPRRLGWRGRALGTLGLATAIEVGQLFWDGRSRAGELLIGSTFDAWDLVAYAVGVVIAVAWDARTAATAATARGARAASWDRSA